MQLFAKLFGAWSTKQSRPKKYQFERLEPRELLNADPIAFGAVYYEDALAGGTDDIAPGDLMEITFEGGAPNTQLTELTIDLDPGAGELAEGDIFFDTAAGGNGTSGFIPLSIVSNNGIDQITFSVTSNELDDRQQLTITFSGFDAGDSLVIGFDVDEVGEPNVTPTVEGAEFEGSTLTATFQAETFYDETHTATFYNDYNDALNATDLDLPPDDYIPPGTIAARDYTAGAIGQFEQTPLPITIAGTVYEDSNGNNQLENGEDGIAGVELELWRLEDEEYVATGRTTTTDAEGNYLFDDVLPGTYQVVEIQPTGYFDIGASAGQVDGEDRGTVVSENIISEITLVGGEDSIENNFAESLPASLAGTVYHDVDNDGVLDQGENGISGVTIQLFDDQGQLVETTVTDENGEYQFDQLVPGSYSIAETQPQAYLDGRDTPGTAGGTAANPGDSITGIGLLSDDQATGYNFGELVPAAITGQVHADLDGDCIFDPGEAPIAEVVMELLDDEGKVVATTLTNESGTYLFANLPPGTYGVRQVQPEGFLNGEASVGDAGGVVSEVDTITGISLDSGQIGSGYHFCEVPPASLSGRVYIDANENGSLDAEEVGIGGVTVELLDNDGQTVATTTTDADGNYLFDGLAPGMYQVVEVQPTGFFDGLDTAGTAGGVAVNPGDHIHSISLLPGQDATGYLFGELEAANLFGRVIADLDEDCIIDPEEAGIAGVTIELLDDQGSVLATTVTDAEGAYSFTELEPGSYTVRQIQPAGYYSLGEKPGSEGGMATGDAIENIELGSGDDGNGYNFFEAPFASLAGRVFQDGETIRYDFGEFPSFEEIADIRDGQYTPDDQGLGGVTLFLTDATGEVLTDGEGTPISVQTSSEGTFVFENLRAGEYGIRQAHPFGYTDWLDTAGTSGGNPFQPGDEIRGIQLDPGIDATGYWFSEVRLVESTAFPVVVENTVVVSDLGPILQGVQRSPVPVLPAPIVTQAQVIDLGAGFSDTGATIEEFTWHLSVIDGGYPRGDQIADNGWEVMTPAKLSARFWTAQTLDQGEWITGNSEFGRVTFGSLVGIPVTGDFNGDGVTDVGIYADGEWFIDLNANGQWDEGDLWAKLGRIGDSPVTGDWNGDGKTDIGVFGPAWEGDEQAISADPGLPGLMNHSVGEPKNLPPEQGEAPATPRLLKLTSEGEVRTDPIDHTFRFGQSGDVAISGDWNGDGHAQIGVVRDGIWRLDLNGNGRWDAGDIEVDLAHLVGEPVVGDFNGDGLDDIGLYHQGQWHLDTNGDRRLDALDRVFEMGGPGEEPVVGDWDGDGRDEPGIYRPEGKDSLRKAG